MAAVAPQGVVVEWSAPGRHALVAAVAIELATGLPAIPSGVALVRNGMGMPESWIAHSLLPDFTIPGVLLLVLIGGGMTTGAIVTLRRPDLTGPIALGMGVLLLAWLAVETLLLGWHGGPQWVLDPVYACLGLALAAIGWRSISIRLR